MDLQELHDKLLSEGCNRFYIEGIGGPQDDDVECLSYNSGQWQVCYMERGQKGFMMFSTPDKTEAIQYYYDHIMSLEHWHLVAITRSSDILSFYKGKLEKLKVRIIQNDIPNYSTTDDRVYRLFVTNKDIFIVQKKVEAIPYYDTDLKR